MGDVSKSVLVHRVDKSPKMPDSGDSTEPELLEPKNLLTCPKENSTCPNFECNVDLNATGAYYCAEETTKNRPQLGSQEKDKHALGSSVQQLRHSHHRHNLSRYLYTECDHCDNPTLLPCITITVQGEHLFKASVLVYSCAYQWQISNGTHVCP